MRRNRAYTRARLASERILADAYRAADQLSADVSDDAEARFRAGQLDAAAKNAAYALAGDARAAAYHEAEQRHRDRMAAIQRHFGQQVMSRGDPDADHALDFVETDADPERLFAPFPAEAPIGRVVEIDYNGIKRQVRVDARGRVAAYADAEAGDGWVDPRDIHR
jgi:hypothetical protein